MPLALLRSAVPRVRVLPEKEGDRRRRPELQQLRTRQSSPSDLAGEAEHVEPRRIVAIETRRQHRPLPRAGRHLESVEERDRLAHAVEPGQLAAVVDVMPREQEPHEVRRRDRLDLRAQPIERVAMDAGQQRAVAPFEPPRRCRGRDGVNRPRNTTPSASSASSPASASVTGDAEPRGQRVRGRPDPRS